MKAQIIPTVISEFEPVFELSVVWKRHHNSEVASLGNTLKPSHLQHAPTVQLERAQPLIEAKDQPFGHDTSETNYVLALTDPDAPSRKDPKWSEFCHWIATGLEFPTSSPSSSQIIPLDLQDVESYYPPGPPPKTGKHRYVFLVFVPANGTTEELHLSKPSQRKHWGRDVDDDPKAVHGVRQWAHDNGLVPIGEF